MEEREESVKKKKSDMLDVQWKARTNKKTVLIVVFILVLLSIAFTRLTSQGLLNIAPYTSALRSIFGNTFGG